MKKKSRERSDRYVMGFRASFFFQLNVLRLWNQVFVQTRATGLLLILAVNIPIASGQFYPGPFNPPYIPHQRPPPPPSPYIASWEPVDAPIQEWIGPLLVPSIDPVLMGRIESGPGAAERYMIAPVSWPKAIVQLNYCVVNNPLHPVLMELIETAFDAWGSYLPAVGIEYDTAHRGLNFTFDGYCPIGTVGHQEEDGLLTINLGRTIMDTTGITSRRFALGTSHPSGMIMEGADMALDVRLMQSAGLFYNTLLHETGHLLGCDHPDRDPSSAPMSVMGSSVWLETGFGVVQENWYNILQPGDVKCLSSLYARDFPGVLLPDPLLVYPIVPRYPAHLHVSGDQNAEVPLYIPVSAADRSVLLYAPTPRATTYPTKYPTSPPRPTPRPSKRITPRPTPRPSTRSTPHPTGRPTLGPTKQPPVHPRDRLARRRPRRPGHQDISADLSANMDVLVEGAANAVVNVNAVVDPFVDISGTANLNLDLVNNADSRITIAQDNTDIDLTMKQNTLLEVGDHANADVSIESVTNPDVFVGPDPSGWSRYGYDYYGPSQYRGPQVDLDMDASPHVTVNGDNANINIRSHIVPSITIRSPRGNQRDRERRAGPAPADWAFGRI